MNRIKVYEIHFGRIEGKESNKIRYLNDDEKVTRICKIIYSDNSNYTIEDLKEYIYNLSNFTFCPCMLKICNNYVNEYSTLYRSKLDFCEYDDKNLLSSLDLNDRFYVIAMLSIKCKCPYNYKNYCKYSKRRILSILNDNEEKYKTEKNDIYQKQKERYDNLFNKNKENESKINNLKNKIKENEKLNQNLANEKEKEKKTNIDFQRQINGLNEEKDKLNLIIKTNVIESKEKDNLIQKLKDENEIYKVDLSSFETKLKRKEEEIQNQKNEIAKNTKYINGLTEKINNLNNSIQNQNQIINNLNTQKDNQINILNNTQNKLKEVTNNIKIIEKQRDNNKNNLENSISQIKELEKNIKLKEENEKKLNKKIVEIENTKKEMSVEIEKLKKEISLLTLAVKKDVGTLTKFHELGLLRDIHIENNCIQIDPKTNRIIQNKNEGKDEDENEKEKELKEFYDIIVNIKSVKDISKGWEIKMTENGEKNFNLYKSKELIKIGVIGNSNKGKSFILSRLSGIDLPSGTSIKTEGLSIKYPELKDHKDRKIVLLDSAGLETPVLREDINQNNKKNIKSDNQEEENNINISKNITENDEGEGKKGDLNEENSNMKNNANDKEENKLKGEENAKENNENGEKPNAIFKEKSKEKLITELFLQNYIINNSDILILVVGILTYSEQKLLNRIKTDILKLKMNKPLYIIHNLKTFFSKKQVEDYIQNNLMKSATFELKEGHKISSSKESEDGCYYFEKNSNPKIFHLIFANEGSKAGIYYNNFTLKFIENAYQEVTDLKAYDVIQTIKERFIVLSQEIIEKSNEEQKQFKLEDIIDDNEIMKNKVIKLKKPKTIVLKRCLIDELGFSNLRGNGFEPQFNYYYQEEENKKKIIIRVEAPGNSIISSQIEYSGEYTIIKLVGTKKPDKTPKYKIENIHTSREFGEFNLDIPLKTEDYTIKNAYPTIIDKKGIIILEYECEDKNQKYDYSGKDDDEV